MFVACDPEQAPWRKINSTYGISRILSFAEGPKPMPEALIAGQSVEMHSGPFSNFIATVEQMASDARIWVLLDFMGKATRIQVDR